MKYLVPYDFTSIGRCALKHAFAIAKAEPGQIDLLHVVADPDEELEVREGFEDLLAELTDEEKKKIITKVRVGNIFNDIGKEAEERDCQLIIMGTHGAKGLQKLFGSYAIRVITSSGVPFIITQSREPGPSIKTIVLPVDLSYDKILIVKFASQLAKKFDAEIHVISKPQTDEFLKHRLQNNMNKVSRKFAHDGVKYQISSLEGRKAFHTEVIEYGEKVGADLFAIAHFPETILPQFENFSQTLITNNLEVPVLVVNAQEVASVNSTYSFVGI